MSLTMVPVVDGFLAFNGDKKIAQVRTRDRDGSHTLVKRPTHYAPTDPKKDDPDDEKCHVTNYVDIPKEQWEIRFTGGSGTLAEFQEIMAHDPGKFVKANEKS